MAHESFEDIEVAEFLNQHFVAIKVDKEERPDVDSIYMSVCQGMTGSGGWPLTIFMMPDQKPFFAGTYFPKQSRYNIPGFLDLLKAVIDKWEIDQESLKSTSLAITKSLQKDSFSNREEGRVEKQMVRQAAKSLLSHFDANYGGFGRAPKFPTPHNLMFLLRYAVLEKDKSALAAVEKTLHAMYAGGLFDHIGFGFSRYSTDEKWLVPHFEKMLYDNALLLHAYLEAYQYTKNETYKQIAEKTLEYVQRELTHEEGGFFCAQDADSEGVEGKYYVFEPEEVIAVLGEEDGAYFNSYYDITDKGNFEGKSIPNRIKACVNGKSDLFEEERISRLRTKMYDYRYSRTKLHKDDKILTSWNGIMIGACAKAYKILRQEKYLKMAKKADEFLQNYLIDGDKLYVHYREKSASGEGHIDDYVFYSWALLEMYEATFKPDYLKRALRFMNRLIEKFFDRKQGGFYLYGEDAEVLIHRPKEVYDGAIPSGNSVAAYVLKRLYQLTGNQKLLEVLDRQLSFLSGQITGYPSAYCFAMMAVMQEVYPTKELVCVLDKHHLKDDIKALLAEYYLPQMTVLCKTEDEKENLEEFAEFLKAYPISSDKPSYYLCENHTCQAPVHDLKELEKKLEN